MVSHKSIYWGVLNGDTENCISDLMDVHRDFVICLHCHYERSGCNEYQARKFSTYTEELHELKKGGDRSTISARMFAWN